MVAPAYANVLARLPLTAEQEYQIDHQDQNDYQFHHEGPAFVELTQHELIQLAGSVKKRLLNLATTYSRAS